MLIAHRGKVDSINKENTIEAFKAAINDIKYGGFELDIRETKDKKIVVVHDFVVDNKLIKRVNYKELERYNIPLLESVLKLDTEKIIMIEIKDPNMDIEALRKLLEKYQDKKIYLMSFYNNVIKEFLKLSHTCKCGILNYGFNHEYSYNEYDFICILDFSLTDNIIEYFRRRKIEVFSYGLLTNKLNIKEYVNYIIDNKN
ncbi:MAG: glycerophosphodiester phosphodiesterase [Bacilli bacterium]|nr:glycerophosphodiester phosphodiesterase [Bacilli bacterium]